MEHVVSGSARQCGKIGETAEPFIIIRNDGGDLRLLEHELGDKDCVRIAHLAPGEIAAVAAKPAEKRAAKR